MKLVLFMSSFRGGGAEKVFTNLANYFSLNGVEVTVCVCDDNGPNKKYLNNNIEVVNYNSSTVFGSVFKHIHYIIKNKPDVAFSNTISCNSVNSISKGFSKILGYKTKFVAREANIAHSTSLKMSIRNYIAFFLYKFIDGIILNSEDTYKSILATAPKLNGIESQIIPNPVFDASTLFGVKSFSKEDCLKIISVGRISTQKNYSLAIETAKILKQMNIPFTYHIYGIGPEKNAISSLINNYSLQENVILKGYCEDINSIYSSYDVFFLTSLWEGFGNVIVEAFRSGLPVVSTPSKGGVPFLITDPRLGTISQFSPQSLANDLVNAKNFESDNSISFRVSYSKQFQTNIIGQRYLEFIKEVSR